MTEPSTPGQTPHKVKVWDIPVRVFHWSLVVLIGVSYLTGEFGGFDFTMPGSGNMVANLDIHLVSGLGILTLVLFRVVWGFMGSTTARFTNFLAGPGAIVSYVGGLFKSGTKFIAGHNPAGGVVVVLLLLSLLMQAGTGLFSKEDDFFGNAGPLNSLISEDDAKIITQRHKQIWGYIELLIVLHIAANIFYWLVLKQNLIIAMFTGNKDAKPEATVPELRFVGTARAVIVLFVVAGAVWGITRLGS